MANLITLEGRAYDITRKTVNERTMYVFSLLTQASPKNSFYIDCTSFSMEDDIVSHIEKNNGAFVTVAGNLYQKKKFNKESEFVTYAVNAQNVQLKV